MRGRALTAIAILVAWIGGVGMLVRREFFRPNVERLAEAALRVNPGAVFFAVLQGDKQVGFASSTIDTSTAQIEQRDYLVADIPVGGALHRATARTNVIMSRTMRMKTFEISVEADETPTRVEGRVLGDTLLRLVIATGANAVPETATVALTGPILLPTLVPIAVALGETPSVGKSYVLPVFDAASMTSKNVRIEVRAESLFTVNDSSVLDSASRRWRGVLPVPIRAWQIASEGGSGVGGWVDEQGRLVASAQLGFRLERRPYEVAYENWRLESEAGGAKKAAVPSNRDVLETTAIAANKRLSSSLSELRVRLGGLSFRGFDLNGGRQRLRRDTLIVRREPDAALSVRYQPFDGPKRDSVKELRAEPLLEVKHPEIVALARRLARGSRDPREIAERINRWVHDSLRKEVTVGIPSALQVLRSRRGDCNEHAQLFVALSRAAGVPARVAAGLAYLDGKFYYHAWPEVFLRNWVGVDPTFGQFPADASHLRFVAGGLARQAELLRLVGGLTIDVVHAR